MQWMAASEYASGQYHTLFFYGQDYNPMIEALFASPFVRIGIPPYIILPIITPIMALTPWIAIAYIIYKQTRKWLVALFLLILSALPYEFHIVNSISRGWVHGLFFAGIGIHLLYLATAEFKLKNIFLIGLAGLLGGAGVYICPNALLLFIPISIYWLFLTGIRKAIFFQIFCSVCFLIGIYITKLYCSNFPYHSYIKHWNTPIELDWAHFFQNLKYFYGVFYGMFPGFAYAGIILFFLMAITIRHTYKSKQYIYFGTLISMLFIFVFILFSLKSINAQLNPFFPYMRFYLAMPMVIYMILILTFEKWLVKHRLKIIYSLLVCVFINFALIPLYNKKSSKMDEFVRVVPVSKLCIACDSIEAILKKRNEKSVLIKSKCDEIAFGCAALGSKINFLYPLYERNKKNKILFETTDTTNLLHISYEHETYVFK